MPVSICWNSFCEVVGGFCFFPPDNFARNFDEPPLPVGSIEFCPRKAATEDRRFRLEDEVNELIGKSSPRPSDGTFVLSCVKRERKK